MRSFLIRDILSGAPPQPPPPKVELVEGRADQEEEDEDEDGDDEEEEDVEVEVEELDSEDEAKSGIEDGRATTSGLGCRGNITNQILKTEQQHQQHKQQPHHHHNQQQQQQQQQHQQQQLLSQMQAQFQLGPLDALFQMTSSTFDALKRGEKRKAGSESTTTTTTTTTSFTAKQNPKKKRKSRTAFTNSQIYELERRFRMQKYLSPTDRDEIAMTLNLSNAQVITWFQNRRAKMKRDLEEQRRDIETASLLNLQKTFFESLQALSQLKTTINPED